MEMFIWFVVTTLLSIALAPKPKPPKAAALEDFSIPVAEEGRAIPVVFGEVEITGANVLWYGDLSSSKIKKSTLFSSQTVGYRYHLGLHLGLCHGPVDLISRWRVGEKDAWTGSVTANGSISINEPTLFGGAKREGGMIGTLDVAMGGPTQSPNAYLSATIGPPIGADRGILSLVWRNAAGDAGGYIGNSSYLEPWSFRVRRILTGWSGAPWYPEKAAISTRLMNPAHIIYECVTNPNWGLGWGATKINDAAWRAVADQLHAESFGLALLWAQAVPLEDFIQIVLDHIDGILAFRPSTGQFELMLIRPDYDPETLPVLGVDQISSIEGFQRQSWGETVNELTMTYVDHESGKDAVLTAHDGASIQSQGSVVPATVERRGIRTTALAERVVMRELRARSTPLARMTLFVNRSLWDHSQGDVLKVTWPELEIENMVVRVLKISKGRPTSGEISADVIEDVFSLDPVGYLDVSPTPSIPTDPTVIVDDDDEGGVPPVSDVGTTTPPGSPTTGDRYIVPAGATGAWSGHDGEIAEWDGTQWVFYVPTAGMLVWVAASSSYYFFDGTTWDVFSGGGAVERGDIGGTLADQTDLQSALDGKSPVGHDHDSAYLPIAAAAALAPPGGATGEVLKKLSATDYDYDWAADATGGGGGGGVAPIGATWVRAPGVPIATPVIDIPVPVLANGTIQSVTVVTEGGSGSCVIDIWKDTLANYPPTVADSICGSAKPTISAAQTYFDNTLTGWTTSLVAGDVLRFHLDSSSNFESITVRLNIT